MKKYIHLFHPLLLSISSALASPTGGNEPFLFDGINIAEQQALLQSMERRHSSQSTNSTSTSCTTSSSSEADGQDPVVSTSSSRLNRRRASVFSVPSPANNNNLATEEQKRESKEEEAEEDVKMEDYEENLPREILFYAQETRRITIQDPETGANEHFMFTDLVPIDEVWNIEPDFQDPTTYILAVIRALEASLPIIYRPERHINRDYINEAALTDLRFGAFFSFMYNGAIYQKPYYAELLRCYRGCLIDLINSTLPYLERLAIDLWFEKIERLSQKINSSRFTTLRGENGLEIQRGNIRFIDPNELATLINGAVTLREIIYQRPHIAQPEGRGTALSPLIERISTIIEQAEALQTEVEALENPIYRRDLYAANSELNEHFLFTTIQDLRQALQGFDSDANGAYQYYRQCTGEELRQSLHGLAQNFLNAYITFRHSNDNGVSPNAPHEHECHLNAIIFKLLDVPFVHLLETSSKKNARKGHPDRNGEDDGSAGPSSSNKRAKTESRPVIHAFK